MAKRLRRNKVVIPEAARKQLRTRIQFSVIGQRGDGLHLETPGMQSEAESPHLLSASSPAVQGLKELIREVIREELTRS